MARLDLMDWDHERDGPAPDSFLNESSQSTQSPRHATASKSPHGFEMALAEKLPPAQRIIRKPLAPSQKYDALLKRKIQERFEIAKIDTYRDEELEKLRQQPSDRVERARGSQRPRKPSMSHYGGGDRRYGGGGGGRKRRYRDDDEYERGPPPRRRRDDREPASAKLRNLVVNVGDVPMRDPESTIMEVARLLSDNYEDEYLHAYALELLAKFIQEQPLKVPFAAAMILHLHASKPEFAQNIIDKIGEELQKKINQGKWRSAKLLLRSLALLSSLFEGEGVFGVLEELFNRAVDLQSASSEDVLGLELVKTIMLTVPYILAWNSELRSEADSILEKTAVVASTSHAVEAAVVPFLEVDGEDVPQSLGILGILHEQLQNEAESGFELKFLFRSPPVRRARNEDEDNLDSDAPRKLTFPTITVPETLKSAQPIFPEIFFSMYADQEVESVPKTSNLASTLLRDALVDTVNIVDYNRTHAASCLINMDAYFAPNTFTPRATPFDKLRDADEGQPTWKSEDVLIDAIFSQLLLLPTPKHKLAYFHSVITEACRFAPAAIAPSLGRAIRFLYKSCTVLDHELAYRFMDWFSHHLSNFDFRWKWVEWSDDVNLSPLHPRKSFLLGALDKEVRLSFAKRIRETLPAPYHRLIPAKRDNERPEFKFAPQHNNQFSAQGIEVLDLLKRKAPDDEFDSVIKNIHELAVQQDPSITDPTPISTDVFVTCLCQIGFKSLSHFLSFIERNRPRLLTLMTSSGPAHLQLITSVADYWVEHNPGLAVSIMDKLLNYTVIAPADVLQWALSTERLQGGAILASHWVFELVSCTLEKVARRLRQVAEARAAVDARGKSILSPSQASELEQTLSTERASLQALHSSVDDALAGVASGANDAQIENKIDLGVLKLGTATKPITEGDGAGADEELSGEGLIKALRLWGEKWQRVFRRKLAVEMVILNELESRFPATTDSDENVGSMIVDADANGPAAAPAEEEQVQGGDEV